MGEGGGRGAGGGSDQLDLPSLTAPEEAEMMIYAAASLIGIPLNLVTLRELVRQFRRSPHSLALLHINLNLSDLAVLSTYALGRLCWLATYQWRGGDTMCRLMRFLEELSFAISSNVIVAIALDRLFSLSRPAGITAEVGRTAWTMLAVAWGLAVAVSAPQLWVYQAYKPWASVDFTQCVTFWAVGNNSLRYGRSMALYQASHVMVIFWLPALLLVSVYSLIVHHVLTSVSVASLGSSRQTLEESGTQATQAAAADARSLLARPALSRNSRATSSKRSQRNQRKHSAVRKVSGHNLSQRNKVRAIRTSVFLTSFYIACWLPYCSLALFSILNLKAYKAAETSLGLFYCLIVLNSVLNPLLYGRLRLFRLSQRLRRLCQRRRNP